VLKKGIVNIYIMNIDLSYRSSFGKEAVKRRPKNPFEEAIALIV
jgi:hypothetical protein